MSKLVEFDLNPDIKTLRQFGFIAVGGFGVLAALAYYERLVFSFGLGSARVPFATALAAIGLLAGLISLVAPRANRVLYVGLTLLAFPVGIVLSYLILGALFFLIIGPIAVLFRVARPDPLRRRFDPATRSYWEEARPARDKESYFHQY